MWITSSKTAEEEISLGFVEGPFEPEASAVAGGKQRHGSGRWQGKCLDLSKSLQTG